MMDYPIRTLQQIRPLLVGFRKRAGLSQTEVAALVGVTQQTYAKMEANPASASVERLFTILRLLGSEIVLTHRDDAGQAIAPDTVPDTRSATQTTSASTATRKSRKALVVTPAKVIPPSNKTEDW